VNPVKAAAEAQKKENNKSAPCLSDRGAHILSSFPKEIQQAVYSEAQ